MIVPNYNDGSIVNVISSILHAYRSPCLYKPARRLSPKSLQKKNIILLLIDGLGYEYIRKYGKGTLLHMHMKDRLTSIYPSATAACITSVYTGTAPLQHGVTGWNTNSMKLGSIFQFLPGKPKSHYFQSNNMDLSKLIKTKSIFEKISVSKYNLLPKKIAHSPYNRVFDYKTKLMQYETLSGCMRQISKIIKSHHRKKMIYAYWPSFDAVCHHHGVNSKATFIHFIEIVAAIERLCKSLQGTDTTLIITADHGLLDVAKPIIINEHPKLIKTLSVPLCGEPRAPIAYVRASKEKEFETYVTTRLKKYCTLLKKKEALYLFGLGKPTIEFDEQMGDYILLMKNNYAMYHLTLGEAKPRHRASHGGTSPQEMYIPLVVIDL